MSEPASREPDGSPPTQGGAPKSYGSAKLVKRLALVMVGAFVFTFSLVPLYRIACEKIIGIKLQQGPSGEQRVAGVRATGDRRVVTVEFDGNVNSALEWGFHPTRASVRVHPGDMVDATYWARNESDHAIVGNAAPSVAPAIASSYFHKTECFCFTQQLLQAGEQKLMPVRFYVDPALPADVSTLTLSYTFYNNEEATARLAAKAPALASRSQ